jgi:hypothetical protein
VFFTYLLATLACAARSTPVVRTPVQPYVTHLDESQSFDEVIALIAGSGVTGGASPHATTEYAGFRLGVGCCLRGKHPDDRGETVTVDLGWDRLRSRSAFSFEMSLMVGVFRLPRPIRDQSRRFVRVYAEPGVGIRTAGGAFVYYSAKAMIAFMSDAQIDRGGYGPVVEIQYRVPWSSMRSADARVMVGMMTPLCKHCGWE